MPLKLDDVGEHGPAMGAKALPGERGAGLGAAPALKQHLLRLPPRLCRTQKLYMRDVDSRAQGGSSLAQKALEE